MRCTCASSALACSGLTTTRRSTTSVLGRWGPPDLVHGIGGQGADLNRVLESAVERGSLAGDCAGGSGAAIELQGQLVEHAPDRVRLGQLGQGWRPPPGPRDGVLVIGRYAAFRQRGSSGSRVERPVGQRLPESRRIRTPGRKSGTRRGDQTFSQALAVTWSSMRPLHVNERNGVLQPGHLGYLIGPASRKAGSSVERGNFADTHEQCRAERLG